MRWHFFLKLGLALGVFCLISLANGGIFWLFQAGDQAHAGMVAGFVGILFTFFYLIALLGFRERLEGSLFSIGVYSALAAVVLNVPFDLLGVATRDPAVLLSNQAGAYLTISPILFTVFFSARGWSPLIDPALALMGCFLFGVALGWLLTAVMDAWPSFHHNFRWMWWSCLRLNDAYVFDGPLEAILFGVTVRNLIPLIKSRIRFYFFAVMAGVLQVIIAYALHDLEMHLFIQWLGFSWCLVGPVLFGYACSLLSRPKLWDDVGTFP